MNSKTHNNYGIWLGCFALGVSVAVGVYSIPFFSRYTHFPAIYSAKTYIITLCVSVGISVGISLEGLLYGNALCKKVSLVAISICVYIIIGMILLGRTILTR